MSVLTALSALWLGVLASVSPCPLAANLAAFSFIQKEGLSPRRVLLSGTLYSAGRTVTFAVAGVIVISGLTAIPEVSLFMQRHMNRLIGPILLIVGVFVLDLIEVRGRKPLAERVSSGTLFRGAAGAFLMGILFALAICPVSAALFFGGLIPLAAEKGSRVVLPALFGLGSGLPVTALSFIFSMGARAVSRSMGAVYNLQKIIQAASGVILILIGLYFSLTSTFGLL